MPLFWNIYIFAFCRRPHELSAKIIKNKILPKKTKMTEKWFLFDSLSPSTHKMSFLLVNAAFLKYVYFCLLQKTSWALCKNHQKWNSTKEDENDWRMNFSWFPITFYRQEVIFVSQYHFFEISIFLPSAEDLASSLQKSSKVNSAKKDENDWRMFFSSNLYHLLRIRCHFC